MANHALRDSAIISAARRTKPRGKTKKIN